MKYPVGAQGRVEPRRGTVLTIFYATVFLSGRPRSGGDAAGLDYVGAKGWSLPDAADLDLSGSCGTRSQTTRRLRRTHLI